MVADYTASIAISIHALRKESDTSPARKPLVS